MGKEYYKERCRKWYPLYKVMGIFKRVYTLLHSTCNNCRNNCNGKEHRRQKNFWFLVMIPKSYRTVGITLSGKGKIIIKISI